MYTANLNDKVRVWLTTNGKDEYQRYIDELTLVLGSEVSQRLTVRPNEDGSLDFFMWDLMRIFGKRLSLGCEIPFVNNRIDFL
jgi:hypothetical protein